MTRDHLACEAAGFAQVMAFNLLAMRCPYVDQKGRLEASERAFQIWAALCRRMSDLEAACPATAATGYAQAQRLRDFAEDTAERSAKPRETIMKSSISGVKA